MFIIYDGPSTIDAAPVTVIVTGVEHPSANLKTGPMAQAYILRTDVHPVEARNAGKDVSVCGGCLHRLGSCYVQLEQAVHGVFQAYHRDRYTPITPVQLADRLNQRNRAYRISAYGDPTAVPFEVWSETLERLKSGHTGYVHGWRYCDPRFKQYFMASVDSPSEQYEAQELGWRTYRIRMPHEPVHTLERTCPASDEAGKQVQCVNCLACDGAGRPSSITTLVHGSSAKRKRFTMMRQAYAPFTEDAVDGYHPERQGASD